MIQRWPSISSVVDFVVGDGGAELGVPVDQTFASEDLAGLEEVEEGAADGPGSRRRPW